MSLYDYELSRRLLADDPSFDALIFAAMRKADSTNIEKLREGWPELADEMDARYHAPGGRLPEDGPVPDRGETTDPADVCNVGDPDPNHHLIGPCCKAERDGYGCTRTKDHRGQHVAGGGKTVLATWHAQVEATP